MPFSSRVFRQNKAAAQIPSWDLDKEKVDMMVVGFGLVWVYYVFNSSSQQSSSNL